MDALADWVIPFFSIWVLPRSTIRRVVDTEPDGPVIAIAWTLGALIALTFHVLVNAAVLPFEAPDWIKQMGPAAMGMTIFSSGIAAIGLVYLLGFIYNWAGRLLGGIADVRDVRSAIAWGWVPLIILSLVVMTATVFAPTASSWDRAPETLLDRISAWNVAEVAIAIWSVVVSIQTLAEVHRFSAARALGAKATGVAILAFFGLGMFIVMTLVSLVVSLI